jgi:hypothetical protein
MVTKCFHKSKNEFTDKFRTWSNFCLSSVFLFNFFGSIVSLGLVSRIIFFNANATSFKKNISSQKAFLSISIRHKNLIARKIIQVMREPLFWNILAILLFKSIWNSEIWNFPGAYWGHALHCCIFIHILRYWTSIALYVLYFFPRLVAEIPSVFAWW